MRCTGSRTGLQWRRKWGQEKLAGAQKNNKQFNAFVPPDSPMAQYFTPPDSVLTPHVLKDGSDSVGALGALNRVYVNIGLFSEEWLEHFNALIGGKKISPFPIAVAERNSVYWKATEAQTFDLAQFMLKSTNAHRLADAPGGKAYLTKDQAHSTGARFCLCRALCALPLQQAARFCAWRGPGKLRGQGLSRMLQPLLEADPDGGIQGEDAHHRPRR